MDSKPSTQMDLNQKAIQLLFASARSISTTTKNDTTNVHHTSNNNLHVTTFPAKSINNNNTALPSIKSISSTLPTVFHNGYHHPFFSTGTVNKLSSTPTAAINNNTIKATTTNSINTTTATVTANTGNNNSSSINTNEKNKKKKKKRKEAPTDEGEKNKKKKVKSFEDEEEDEEGLEEDSNEQLLPIRTLAYIIGLSKDEDKSWRYRDVRRSLFEKLTKEHFSYIEQNAQHAILKQRLPHKLTLVSFCKRIMLLVFHFIIRDGRDPKFFIRPHVKKDLIESTLRNEAPEFFRKINRDIAMKIHASCCAGNTIEQASKIVESQMNDSSSSSDSSDNNTNIGTSSSSAPPVSNVTTEISKNSVNNIISTNQPKESEWQSWHSWHSPHLSDKNSIFPIPNNNIIINPTLSFQQLPPIHNLVQLSSCCPHCCQEISKQ
ncbi:hypothetical protein ABK040_014688 [Willaertia magna]